MDSTERTSIRVDSQDDVKTVRVFPPIHLKGPRLLDKRTDILDYAKGIGIILVVYGHLLSSAFNSGLPVAARYFRLSDSIIYSFHMPLFFFIAGLLADKSFDKRGARKFFTDKLKMLAYPYVVWSLIQMSVELFFQQHTNKNMVIGDLAAVLYRPWAQFWFLYAMVLMYGIFALARKMGRKAFTIASVSAAMIFFYPVKSSLLALEGFSRHFVFFLAGVWTIRWFARRGPLPSFRLRVCWSTLAVFIGASMSLFTGYLEPVRLSKSSHSGWFLVLAITGMTTVFAWANYMASQKKLTILKTIGRYTMPIYLAHMLVGVCTRVVLLKFFGIDNAIVHITLGVGIAIVVPILLAVASQRAGIPYLFSLSVPKTAQ